MKRPTRKSCLLKGGIRFLERQAAEDEARLQTLREALIEGEESGRATPFDFDAFIAGKKSP